jgi:hypothetical protein
MRDDFPMTVKLVLAARAGNRCSNPECRAPTSGPQDDPAKAVNLGVAAHIAAASPGGPRYDATMTAEQRQHAENGIWLCQNCAKRIDNDPTRFHDRLMREWKAGAEAAADAELGRTAVSRPSPDGKLHFELPPEVNPLGHDSSGGVFVPLWSVKVRLIAVDQPLSILGIQVSEEGTGDWTIQEIFSEANGQRLPFPLRVDPVAEFWVRVRAPQGAAVKRRVGPMRFRFRDHTQRKEECHEFVIGDGPPQAAGRLAT